MWAASCLTGCCASCTCGLCTSVAGGITSRSARLAYSGLFVLSLIISWILREVAAPLLEKIPYSDLHIGATVDFLANPETMSAMILINIPSKFQLVHWYLECSPQLSRLCTLLAVGAGSSTTFLSPPSSPRSGSSKSLLEASDVESSKNDKKEIDNEPVSYSYTFFHLIFALASMHSAMLLTGWTSSTSGDSELIDVGCTSAWVRICTEWATAALYIRTLIAPLVLPDRDFSY